MTELIASALQRLKLLCGTRSEQEELRRSFSAMDLPLLNDTPNYSVEELEALFNLTGSFNRARIVEARWISEVGRLEFTDADGARFWFAGSGESCQHLAALAAFQGATFRAALQLDGRVSIVGWCEQWFYGTIASSLTLAKC